MIAARAAPQSGASMNIQITDIGAEFPFNNAMSAGPILLAGLTDVPVKPIPRICTRVSESPIIRPPNDPCFALASVTPSIASTKIKVRTISTINPAATLPFTPL